MKTYSTTDIENYYHHTKFAYNTFWKTKEFHALHFGYWDETTENFGDALRRENEILANMAKIKSSDIVLDAGCGVGGSSIYLAHEIGCEVKGITVSPYQVEEATKNAKQFQVDDKTEFSNQDYLNTKFEDNTFDVIWGLESVCHANSKEDFLKEAYRILKPNGRIIVADYFLIRQPESETEVKLLMEWTNGWILPYVENAYVFTNILRELGFYSALDVNSEEEMFVNATLNALPSSKRLHDVSVKAKPIVTLLKLLRLRNEFHLKNIKASISQYKLLQQHLWQYCIFSAIKNR